MPRFRVLAHRRRTPAVLASAALVTAGLPLTLAAVASSADAATASTPRTAAASAPQHDVIANLWEWNWKSVRHECQDVLGPKGYGGVQVAPPQDSLKRTKLGDGSDTVLHPWWEVYQPVDYGLTSRMGTESQFRSMVSGCRLAGVKVYVDTVINHMTGQGNTSYGGVSYTKYRYAGLYTPGNFHRYPTDCSVPADAGTGSREGNIADFNDYRQVFNCELVGLSDLRTGSTYVRVRLAAYLNKLLRYGVSGFRVDAAKHISQQDLAAIESRLDRTRDGERPYIALENFPGSPGRLAPQAFTGVGSLLGFDAAYQLKNAFKSYNSPPNDGNIGDLKVWGEAAGLLPSDKTLVFVQNHDTERGGDTLSYKDGATNLLANQFLLAYGYGRPQVYAAFTFGADTAQSPPSDANGFITNTDCSSAAWACVDRDHGVANMVGWHNEVAGTTVRNWYDDGVNLIAFSRGSRGWIAINNETSSVRRTFRTGLAAGRYCNVIRYDVVAGACTGPTVRVLSDGTATVTVRAKDSVAFTVADRVSS